MPNLEMPDPSSPLQAVADPIGLYQTMQVDKEAYSGKMEYVPVRRKGYWEVELESITFGDETLELENTGAAIDTGTSLIAVRDAERTVWSWSAGCWK